MDDIGSWWLEAVVNSGKHTKTIEHHHLFVAKSSIHGWFSIALCMFTRGQTMVLTQYDEAPWIMIYYAYISSSEEQVVKNKAPTWWFVVSFARFHVSWLNGNHFGDDSGSLLLVFRFYVIIIVYSLYIVLFLLESRWCLHDVKVSRMLMITNLEHHCCGGGIPWVSQLGAVQTDSQHLLCNLHLASFKIKVCRCTDSFMQLKASFHSSWSC